MNESESQSSLNRDTAAQLPVRLLHNPYFIHRTPIGGYYLDPKFNLKLVKSPVEKLSLFLADAQRVVAPGDELGKVTYEPRENLRPLRYIHEGAIQEFEDAARSFYTGGTNDAQTVLREHFRLPDPGKEPDAYWVWGERFAPRLLILWGCEKEQGSALPLVGGARNVVAELRSKAMSWTRLIREGVELSRHDLLAAYIAFPVLTPEGKLTHVDRLVNGEYVREEVHAGRGHSFKARPLKRLAASSVLHFKKLAQEFYRKGHPAGCACRLCGPNPDATPASGPGTAGAGALSYEQELRRGFRLPDPDLRPDAYLVTGRPLNGQLLVLCPHPGVKDAEEIEQIGKDVKWTEDKARTPEERERARVLRQQFEQDSATHDLYSRYFYAENECLPLTRDEVLGLAAPPPKPAAAAGAGAPPLPPPGVPPPKAAAADSAQTVYDKLWKRRIDWRKVIAIGSGVITLGLSGGISVHFLWPSQLAVVSAQMSNDPALDPKNQRNVIEVQFNNRLGNSLIGEWKHSVAPADAAGQPVLSNNVALTELALGLPEISPANHKLMTVRLTDTNTALEEDGKYTLNIEKARDIWGNTLTTNLPVKVVDKRGPSLVGNVLGVSELNDSIQLSFDEPLDQTNAENKANYGISSNSIKSAKLQPDHKTVVLTTETSFDSETTNALTLSTNITDAATNRNRLGFSPGLHAPLTNFTTNFVYHVIPLQIEKVSAKEYQNKINVVFNRPMDKAPAKTVFQVLHGDKQLEVGAVNRVGDKSVEVVLTNSYMTNGSYTLQITGLKDASGKPGNELSANAPFTYEGPIDHAAPLILPNGLSVSAANRLTLTFNKDLREDTATKESSYTLQFTNSGQWQPYGTRFGAEISGAPNVVVLTFSGNLGNETLRLRYPGVEDLFGNSNTNDMREFRAGITPLIFTVGSAQIVPNSGGTAIQFSLSARITNTICEKASNFQLEDLDGKAIPGLEVRSARITPKANTSDVYLDLSGALDRDKFQVHWYHMRREAEIRDQDGAAKSGQ
jgi:hypothetical protein